MSSHLPKRIRTLRLEPDVGFEEIRHRGRLDLQERIRGCFTQTTHRAQRRFHLPHEKSAVDHEVIIVLPVAGVDIEGTFALEINEVRFHGLFVPAHGAFVVAALHIDVGRHVHEVACIGHKRAQPIPGFQRLFGCRRHLHQVNVEM